MERSRRRERVSRRRATPFSHARLPQATHILAFEGDSKVVFFQGNYDEYAADRLRRLGGSAPKPIKYRKLVSA